MFTEFDEYLKAFQSDDFNFNYWNDEGFTIAQEMLEAFQDADWQELAGCLTERTDGWKKRLAYCLDDNTEPRQLDLLLRMADTEDDELLETVIDSLRIFLTGEGLARLAGNGELIESARALLPRAGRPGQMVIMNFLVKVGAGK